MRVVMHSGLGRIATLVLVCAMIRGAAPVRAGEATLPASGVDVMVLGVKESEQLHRLEAEHSEVVKGALEEPARRILPIEGGPGAWEGGKFSFVMKVDPERQNYFTAHFWGDEVDKDLLVLFCEGKQVGYRHLGDIDILALPDDEPRCAGRFYYVTTPLPLGMTKGKNEVKLEIRGTGTIWGYGANFEQFQKAMTTPARGVYRVYTHTDGCFVAPAHEKQGEAPKAMKRTAPGEEVLEAVKERVNGALKGMMKSARPLNQMEVQFLARAYFVKWSAAHEQKAAVEQVVRGVDELYKRWKADPAELWKDKATWNPDWFGVGPAGDAVRRMAKALEASLDEKIDGDKTRRAAWSELFVASRDWLRGHRRWLSNQAMFTDVNLYLSNRAVAAIDPARALAEEKARDYLYQAAGLSPWLGVETDGNFEKPLGDSFYQVTEKGLTRELGYVGGYGEVGTAGVMDLYEATRDAAGEGDAKIKAQLAKMIQARGVFRYPLVDSENYTAMRLETGVGWRDAHFPGGVMYVQPAGGDQSALCEAAATLDAHAIGYAQQMMEEGQFFATVAGGLKDRRFRETVGLLGLPEQYELIQAQARSEHRLPMSKGRPDFVFADEEDGVVAIKHGEEILYASLYWRAGFGVNSLARVHHLTPRYQQIAVVREEVVVDASGEVYKRPDWINFGFGNGGTHIKYPRDLHQAYAGEELPVAKMPAGVTLKAGGSNVFAGRGEFYTLRYGPYLIGMNMTKEKSFELKVPAGAKGAVELVSKLGEIAGGSGLKVGPRSTSVLYLTDVP